MVTNFFLGGGASTPQIPYIEPWEKMLKNTKLYTIRDGPFHAR